MVNEKKERKKELNDFKSITDCSVYNKKNKS